MTPNSAVRNVLVSAVAWATSRQKLRELTKRYEDLQDRKSTTKDDLVKLRKELDKAKEEIVKAAEKHEKVIGEFGRLQVSMAKTALRPRRRPIDLKGLVKGVGTVAAAFEKALEPAPTPGGWKPPLDAINVEVIDATPPKRT